MIVVVYLLLGSNRARTSAPGYKRTLSARRLSVRFAPESRHSDARNRLGLKKRTLDVRYYPESGRNWVWLEMSASDPLRTLPAVKPQQSETENHGSLTDEASKLEYSLTRAQPTVYGEDSAADIACP